MARKKITDLKPGSKLRKAIEKDKLIDADLIGAFHRNPTDTSLAAALGVRTGTGRRKVYDVLAQHLDRGLTDEEIMELTNLPPNTARPRRVDLVDMGLAEDSGARRPLRSGYAAILWRLTDGT